MDEIKYFMNCVKDVKGNVQFSEGLGFGIKTGVVRRSLNQDREWEKVKI